MNVRPKPARHVVDEASQSGGFTLLEVLVAFIIMSLALVALLRSGTAGISNVEAAVYTERAISIAQSRLSSFDAQTDPVAEDLQGDDGDYHWRLQVAPIQRIPVRPVGRSQPGPTSFYQVRLTVSWIVSGRHSAIQLVTQRLTPVPPTLP